MLRLAQDWGELITMKISITRNSLSVQVRTFGLLCALALGLSACSDSDSVKLAKSQKELWIYTSLYKDTIADLTPRLEKKFPGIKFHWFQAGSEEIATKVNAEILATGSTKADILISSDRFWYEEMGSQGRLESYRSENAKTVSQQLRNADGFYTTLSVPVMVLSYNGDVISEKDAPKTFKEMTSEKWKGKFSTGSPLASGTNFTTMAMLQHTYGWSYIEGLRTNDTISQGGNSAVVRRIQSKERPVGWVLLENLLRFQGKDKRLKVVYPEDGVVLQSNVIAITKKKSAKNMARKFVDYMFGPEGQNAMIRSYMYSPIESYDPPQGAPKFSTLTKKAFAWSSDFVQKTVANRDSIKEKFSQIMFE